MSTSKEDTPVVKDGDVEASDDTESPSVVTDDSTVGTAQEANANATKSRRAKWYGLAALAAVATAFAAGIGVLVSSQQTEESSFLYNCTSIFKKNKTKTTYHNDAHSSELDVNEESLMEELEQKVDEEEALLSQLPTSLPFPEVAALPSFNADIIQGYASAEDWQADLTTAAQHLLNRVILQNVYKDYYYKQEVWQGDAPRERPVEVAQQAGVSASTASASKTNNQEKNVDEADHVKNDDQYVYASFGDYLIVWDKTGKQIAQVQMPSQWGGHEEEVPVHTNEQWAPPTYINGLLLTPTKVVVLVDGFASSGDFLHHHQGTQVRIYSKPTNGPRTGLLFGSRPTVQMELLQTHELNGIYRDGRWLEDSQTLQLMTFGELNAYPNLMAPLERHHFDNALSPQEYVEAAVELAKDTLIPEFVEGVTEALKNDDALPNHLLRINDWNKFGASTEESVEDIMKAGDYFFSAEGPLQSFLQIVSFQPEEQGTVELTRSIALAPSSSSTEFYATDEALVLALVHADYNPETHQTEENVFLLQLNAASGAFQSVATLPGRITNGPYSLDVQGTDLRVATTRQKWTPLDRVWPLCGDYNPNDSCAGSEEHWNDCFQLAIDGCPDIQKVGCPYQYSCAVEDYQDDSSTENFVVVLDIRTPLMTEIGRVQIGDAHEVITAVRFGETFSYAMTFDQRDPFYVLELPAGQPPVVSGSFKLEGFSRYLHPLNEDATLLVGIGQNVSGTGLAQTEQGVLITVFDVSNPAQPVAVASHMLEQDDSLESNSKAEWDARAVQYANGKLVIPVSMYHQEWNEVGDDQVWFQGQDVDDFVEPEESAVSKAGGDLEKQDFEGFVVLTVGYTGIQEAFRINHLENEEQICHYCNGGLLTSRSIVFDDGSLMTMHGDTVQSNNLYTGRTQWMMNVSLEGVRKDCCW